MERTQSKIEGNRREIENPQTAENRLGTGISGGEGGIRTHVPLRTTAFRVRLVMTTSILLRAFIFNISSKINLGKRRELMERT